MIRTLLFGTVLLAGLAVWDDRLREREATAREESVRVRRLVDPEVAESMTVAALTVTREGASHVYARAQGLWRCVSAHGAVALEESILSVVQKLVSAEGVVHSEDSSRAALYGFHDAQRVGVSVHGSQFLSDPDRDVLIDVEIGLAIPGADGCYARYAGEDGIWAIDRDLRADLAPPGLGNLPPLLDPSVTPGVWIRGAEELRRIAVHLADPFRESYELVRRDVERTAEELERGYPEWEWDLNRGNETNVCEPLRIWAYERFFAHVPYRGILDPEEFRGEDAPRVRARVQVHSAGADPIELRVYDRHRMGGYPVLNSFTGTVYLVTQEIYDLLVPDGDQLLQLDGTNPWEPWLRR